MELIKNRYEAYRRAPDDLRQRFKQAFFTKIYVDEGEMIAQMRKPHARWGYFTFVPLEGLEPPTVSLGRNCSSIELQRLADRA